MTATVQRTWRNLFVKPFLAILLISFQISLFSQINSPNLFSDANGKGTVNLATSGGEKMGSLTIDLGPSVLDQGIGCADNGLNFTYYSEQVRTFILSGPDAVEFTQVSLIVHGATAPQGHLQAFIYTNANGPFPLGAITLNEIASSAIVNNTMVGTNPLDIPLSPTGVAMPGDEVVVKIVTPGNIDVAFRLGYGVDEGETTWVFAPECSLNDYIPFDNNGYSGDLMLSLQANEAPEISQTDYDGDGTPDITDPCACGDPLNIIDGGGNITHFHDFVLVTSNPGETWRITALNSGAIFDAGLVAIPLNTILPEISPGVYRLDLYHPTGVGFNVTVDRTAGGFPFPLATGGTCDAAICGAQAIPTMGEWGLIILALLLLTFSTVFMMKREHVLAGAESISFNLSSIPFDKVAFGKMLGVVMAGLAIIFSTAVFGFGYEMTAADVPGNLIAGPIAAYLLHLVVFSNKK